VTDILATPPLDSQIQSRYVTSDPDILQGEPIVAGTIVAVRDIVQLWKSGVQPEAMVHHLFNRVTIAQIFDALSFYADYPEQIDYWLEKYAGHPTPLMRLNPLNDEVTAAIEEYRREVDARMGLDVA
jgi:uncharacterized protein (DUF433 family)